MNDDVHDYSDILFVEHPISKKHKRMPVNERASQFSPFAALSGYKEAIKEVEKKTVTRKEISQEAKEEINANLVFLVDSIKKRIHFQITYFQKEESSKGTYITKEGMLKKYLPESKKILMDDGSLLSIEDIDSLKILSE